MRIGIDARVFISEQYSGIPQFVYEVIRRWMQQDSENEFYLISNKDIKLPCELPDNWRKVVVPIASGNGTLWRTIKLRGIIKKLKLDCYWGTNNTLPRRIPGCKYLLTIYDLAFEVMPQVVSKKTLLILKTLCKASCKRANLIHTISESTKRDIIDRYRISADKIKVEYLGVNRYEQSNAEADGVAPPEYKFILVLGTIEPRKNIEIIVKAFDLYKSTEDQKKQDIHIIFAGKYGWKYEKFNELVTNSDYCDYIHIWNYVDNYTKDLLLSNAEMLLFPSLYEGFGLPILEAFQHSLMVVTSKNSSLPEVAGDAAIYVDDPYDYCELAIRIKETIDLDDTQKENYAFLMKRQLGKFSWDRCSRVIHSMILNE